MAVLPIRSYTVWDARDAGRAAGSRSGVRLGGVSDRRAAQDCGRPQCFGLTFMRDTGRSMRPLHQAKRSFQTTGQGHSGQPKEASSTSRDPGGKPENPLLRRLRPSPRLTQPQLHPRPRQAFIRVEPEDPATPVHGENALGNPASKGFHAHPDPGSSGGQRLVGTRGHGSSPSLAQMSGLRGQETTTS